MAAARDYNYIAIEQALQESQNEVLRRQSKRRKPTQQSQPLVMRLTTVVVLIISLLIVGLTSAFLVNRYVAINRLQLEIFETKQQIKDYQLRVDQLEMKRESNMTIQEIREYAERELGMIMPSEKNKVVMHAPLYHRLNPQIAFKSGENYQVQAERQLLNAAND